MCDWQTTTQKIAQRGRFLLETGKWSDCKFIVGQEPHQQTIEGHKIFLAMSSPVFEAMFYGAMAEKTDHIPIRDVQPEAFKALLDYIYTDKVDLGSFELACELCYCAKKYMLPYLVEECTKFLWSDLSIKKACRAYEFAKLFEEPVLMGRCLQMICSKTIEVLKEPSWEEIEQSTILAILDQDRLHISSELDLFDALERWAKSECERKCLEKSNSKALRSVIGNALTKIRFLTLSPEEFAEGPAKSPLLTEQEAFSILMNISSTKSAYPMPEGFSSNANPRFKINSDTGLGNHYNPMLMDIFHNPLHMSLKNSSRNSNIMQSLSSMRESTNSFSTKLGSHDIFRITNVPNESLNADVRDKPKNYCKRIILQPSNCRNYDVVDCSITFTVSKNIMLLGVQVPSQISNQLDQAVGMPIILSPTDTYTEVLYAHLLDSDGTRLTYTHYTTTATLGEQVDIFFDRPVNVQKCKIYKLGVVFNKPGMYPSGSCVQRVINENVLFSFNVGNEVDGITDGLIKSIIFSDC